MAIEPGKVAYVKTTQEPVFVVSTYRAESDASLTEPVPELSNQIARVRRPLLGRDGVKHEFAEFFVEELESEEDNAQRRINERVKEASALRAQFGLGGDDEPKAVPPVVN